MTRRSARRCLRGLDPSALRPLLKKRKAQATLRSVHEFLVTFLPGVAPCSWEAPLIKQVYIFRMC